MQNPFGNNNNNDNQNPFNLNNLPLPPNYAKIVNDQGDIRIAKVGFSWTTLWSVSYTHLTLPTIA